MSHTLVYYVVEKDDGFIAIDSHSSGYPYKTSFETAQKYSALEKAMESKRYNNGTGILRCVVSTTKVVQDELQEELRRLALSKLSPDEIRALGLGSK